MFFIYYCAVVSLAWFLAVGKIDRAANVISQRGGTE
jgi:hypothetical protein